MDTSRNTLPPTLPTAALALDGPPVQAPPGPVPPRVCIPMRAQARRWIGMTAVACGVSSMAGFVVGGVVAAAVPMAPLAQSLVLTVPSVVPLVPAGALGLLYYLSKPDQPNRPVRTHA